MSGAQPANRGTWRQTWTWETLDWETCICCAPACSAHVAVLFDGHPLCIDCADQWLDRLTAIGLDPRARTYLPAAYA